MQGVSKCIREKPHNWRKALTREEKDCRNEKRRGKRKGENKGNRTKEGRKDEILNRPSRKQKAFDETEFADVVDMAMKAERADPAYQHAYNKGKEVGQNDAAQALKEANSMLIEARELGQREGKGQALQETKALYMSMRNKVEDAEQGKAMAEKQADVEVLQVRKRAKELAKAEIDQMREQALEEEKQIRFQCFDAGYEKGFKKGNKSGIDEGHKKAAVSSIDTFCNFDEPVRMN